jgi:hypothetical protein
MQLHVTSSPGDPDPSGQFDGMLGMLQRREVHLGITSLTMSPQRLAVIDFTGPTWKFRFITHANKLRTLQKSSAFFGVTLCGGSVLWLLANANAVHISPILVTLMM